MGKGLCEMVCLGRLTGQDVLEREFDVACVKGRGLDERQVVFA